MTVPPLTFRPTPHVSVLMPVFNAARYLGEAIESVLAQTFANFELICVDDGSTDDSLTILSRYAERDGRIRIITRPNTGIVGALNDALDAACGEFVARMDADDTCDPTRLAKQLNYLEHNPACIAVGTWITRTDPFGSPAGSQQPPITHEEIDAGLMRGDGSVLVHATLMMRRLALVGIGGWRRGRDWVEDLDLFLRLVEHGRVANLPQHLYAYRRHVESVCFRNYELMCERLKLVLIEAYQRRGRVDAPAWSDIRPELPPKQSAAEHHRVWACHAIHQNNHRLARRHAWTAMRDEPWSKQSWKVMYWALSA